jgi:hypothetical protein
MEAVVPVPCNRCGSQMVDEHGNLPPPASYERAASMTAEEVSAAITSYGISAPGAIYRVIKLALAHRRRNRAARQRIAAAGEITPISAARGGLVCVRGVVQVLQPPLQRPDDQTLGMYMERFYRPDEDAWETQRGFGRVVVADDSGAAVIDDDYVQLLKPGGDVPRPVLACSVIVRTGYAVEVVGRAERRAYPGVSAGSGAGSGAGAGAGAGAGYRSPGAPLVFDGSSDALLLVRVIGCV